MRSRINESLTLWQESQYRLQLSRKSLVQNGFFQGIYRLAENLMATTDGSGCPKLFPGTLVLPKWARVRVLFRHISFIKKSDLRSKNREAAF